MEPDLERLRKAMEQTHGCRGHFREAVPVVERSGGGEVVWAGIVHAFDLEGHPAASRCYAWSAPIGGPEGRRLMLSGPPSCGSS